MISEFVLMCIDVFGYLLLIKGLAASIHFLLDTQDLRNGCSKPSIIMNIWKSASLSSWLINWM